MIAKFMGYAVMPVPLKEWKFMAKIVTKHGTEWITIDFHSSWSWLMPVVEKIFKLCEEREYQGQISELTIFASIDQVYKAVVDFIVWYNDNK